MDNYVKDSKIVDYIVSLGFDVVKDKVNSEIEAKQVRDRLKKFIENQQKINLKCTREEEIDFDGVANYIQTELLEDVQKRLFGNKTERGVARMEIIDKVISFSQAHTSFSRQRAIMITETAIDILRDFYKKKINREFKFIAAQIEDEFNMVISEQTNEITQLVQTSNEHVIETLSNKLESIGGMSIEKNMQLVRDGEIGKVENSVSNFLDAVKGMHELFPDYCYEYRSEIRQFYSKPVTKDAFNKYPPHIYCTGTIQINGEEFKRLDANTIDYANRHQLPITLNVVSAKKLLGEMEDPVQHEADNLIGESITIPPKPFPPAYPCSISFDGNVMFDYILFRTKEILDDGTCIISNEEQENCPYIIKMFANIKTGKTLYSLEISEATNEELLYYLKVLERAVHSQSISIKVLSLGEELATGQLGNVDYKCGLDKIKTEIDFLEKIVTIERYFKDTISIPEEIMMDDFKIISYLASLIEGKECTGSWSKLDFSMTLTDDLKKRLIETDDSKFALSYVGSINLSFYGKSYEVSIVRTFDSVVYQNLEHLKEKARILDVGDKIKLVFLPGDSENGIWRDCLNNDEIK